MWGVCVRTVSLRKKIILSGVTHHPPPKTRICPNKEKIPGVRGKVSIRNIGGSEVEVHMWVVCVRAVSLRKKITTPNLTLYPLQKRRHGRVADTL